MTQFKIKGQSTAIAGLLLALTGCGGSDGVDKREPLAFNSAPTFDSTPVTNAEAQHLYTYTAGGSDIDGDALTFSATTLPHWLSFDSGSATLSGTPGTTDIGTHEVVLTVSDGALSASQTFSVEVGLSANAGAWNLVWSDEFDGDSVNTDNWGYQTGDGSQYGLIGWGNNELQWYEQNNVSVADGMLKITAEKEDSNGYGYTSGRIRSEHKVDIKYGRIEARVKAPEGQGLWSAFWMLPTDSQYGGWASGGEIDIMELVSPKGDNQAVHGTAHYGMAWPLNQSSGGHHNMNVTDDFHVYAIEWEQDEIRWYVDDIHFATITSDAWWSYYYKDSATGYVNAEGAPFNQNFHMLLNLAVGGHWPGSPDADTVFPATMSVDYVRVYECSVDTATGSGCVNNINTDIEAPAAKTAFTQSYSFYGDAASSIVWNINDEDITRPLKTAIGWDNGGAITLSEVDTGGAHGVVLDVTTSNMGNIVVAAQDGETFDLFGMGSSTEPWKLHAGELKFDLYINSAGTDLNSAILIKMDSGWPALGYKRFEIADLPKDQWFTLSVPVNDLVATPGEQPLKMNSVLNLFVAEFTSAAQVQIDNISLSCGHPEQGGCGINPPNVEVEGEMVKVFTDEVNTNVWTNGIGAWDDVAGSDYFDGNSANHITWSLVETGDDHGTVIEATFGSNGANGVMFIQSGQPVDLSEYAGGSLVFDIKVLDYADTTSGMTFKVDCIWPCSTGDQSLGVVGNGEWETITLSISDLVGKGLNLASVNTGLVIFPTWGDQQGVKFQLDNIRWLKGDGTGGGGTGGGTSGGADGPITIYNGDINDNWELWDCCGGATVTEVADDDAAYGEVAEYTFNSTPTVAGVHGTNPHDASGVANGTLEFDLKVMSQPTDTSGDWLIKIEGISQAIFAEVKLSSSVEGLPPTEGQWQHYTFPLADLEAAGLQLNAIKIIMIFPTWGTGDGAVYRLDNLEIKAN